MIIIKNFHQQILINHLKLIIEEIDKDTSDDRGIRKLRDKTIILVTKDERIHTEFNACRYILSRIPFFWPILIFMYITILSKYLGKIVIQLTFVKQYIYINKY